MGVLDTKTTVFQYTAGSTSDIVLSGWGFQPKYLIFDWIGAASAVDACAAGNINWGSGFGTGPSDQRCDLMRATNGGASAAGATWQRNDACIAVVNDDATQDGYIKIKTIDSGGVTLEVPDSISINLTVMVAAVGGDGILNAQTFQETTNTVTGNKSNTALTFLPTLIYWSAIHDGNNALPGGSNSEAGKSRGVSFYDGSSYHQRCVAYLTDDGSATNDTGSGAWDTEFLVSLATSTPTTVTDRKSIVSHNSNGFTFNQLELPQTASCYFHGLAIRLDTTLVKAVVGDFLTETNTTNTVSETGLPGAPKLLQTFSANRAKSTQDVATAHGNISIGIGTPGDGVMCMALQDENGTANAECANAVQYGDIYANVSTADAIQGLGYIPTWGATSFDFKMSDADPTQCYVWYVALCLLESSTPKSSTDSGAGSEALALTASIGATDSGAGSEAYGQRAAELIDLGAGAETLAETSAIPATDTGAGAETLAETSAIPATDTGAGAETLAETSAIPATDTGAGAETLAGLGLITVDDVGSGSLEALDLMQFILHQIVDAGAASESVALAAALSITDNGVGGDVLTLAVTLSLTDNASGIDALDLMQFISQAVADAAAGSETLSVNVSAVSLDSGVAVEGLSATATITIIDTGAGVDALETLITVYHSISDLGAATDLVADLSVTVNLPDAATADDVLGMLAQVQATDDALSADVVVAVEGLMQHGFKVGFLFKPLGLAMVLKSSAMGGWTLRGPSVMFKVENAL